MGSAAINMKKSINSNQFRPTVARIDLDALRHNFALARQLAGLQVGMLGMVKANAYGHGALAVAKVLEDEGAVALAVATPDEGIELREGGIKAPILLLGGPFSAPGELLVQHRLTPILYNTEQVEFLNSTLDSRLEVQLKIDTGMTRLGILPAEVPSMLKAISKASHLSLSGILTHLAQADTTVAGPTAEQYQRFDQVEALVKKQAPEVQFFHIANSAAILEKKLGPCNWARPGIMLYGANPHPRLEEGKKLKPVMHFETKIVSLKSVPAGTAVSYGGDWVAKRSSRIAVLPVGYADGYIRHLSNVGEVLIRGQKAPVIGRVCMDLTMIDVTKVPGAVLGDTVLLWGKDLPAELVAAKAGTISYELFCAVSPRVPRIYHGVMP
jgi:alanine racemase